MAPLDLEDLLVEAEVRRTVLRYCRGIDRLDAELVRACYHADAVDHHGNFTGSPDEFIEWAFGMLRKNAMTMHLVGNLLVERSQGDPDVAFAETYAVAYHRRPGGQAHHNLVAGFRYVDRFERRPYGSPPQPEWRIAERHVITEWLRTDPPEGWWPITDAFPTGRRDRDDAVYAIRRDG
jgi:hypothetical protein